MKELFSAKELQVLAKQTKGTFHQDSIDTIRIVNICDGIKYTDMFFGSEKNGFKKYYN